MRPVHLLQILQHIIVAPALCLAPANLQRHVHGHEIASQSVYEGIVEHIGLSLRAGEEKKLAALLLCYPHRQRLSADGHLCHEV